MSEILKERATDDAENATFKRDSVNTPSTVLLTAQVTEHSLLRSFNSLPVGTVHRTLCHTRNPEGVWSDTGGLTTV